MPEETSEETVEMESESMRMETQTAGGAATCMMSDTEETMCRPPGKTDSPSKRKGNQHNKLYHSFGSLVDLTSHLFIG